MPDSGHLVVGLDKDLFPWDVCRRFSNVTRPNPWLIQSSPEAWRGEVRCSVLEWSACSMVQLHRDSFLLVLGENRLGCLIAA